MNDKLFDYYNKELIAIRELAKEFAARYPKVAARLDMHDTEISDPYVERLLEGVSFLTARTQLKIDAEYPRFVQRVMEVLYPQFLTQIPSSAIVSLAVSHKQTLNVLHQVNREQTLTSLPLREINENISCQYSVTQALELTPLQILSATYTPSLGYLPKTLQLDRRAVEHSALRVDFSLAIDGVCSDLIPEKLPIYLGSELAKSSQLLNLLMNHCDKVICHSFENPQAWYQELKHTPKQLGFADDEALSFNLNKNVAALRLVQEYIQLPEKFLFIEQAGIKAAIKNSEQQGWFPNRAEQIEEVVSENGVNKRIVGFKKRYFSVSFIFNKHIETLEGLVKAEDFALNATPVVNLFKKSGIRFAVDIQDTQFHVVPDRTQPLNYEIYAIEQIKGFDFQNNLRTRFRPIYQVNHDQPSSSQKYAFFSALREARVPSEKYHKEGGRTSYLGSEVFLSVTDQSKPLVDEHIHQLSVDAWCTNRDLPLLMARSKTSDFLIDNALPVERIKIISKLTRPKEAVDEHESLWSLLNLLNLNLVSLAKMDADANIAYFKALLLSFPHDKTNLYRQQVNAIDSLTVTPASRIVRQHNYSGMIRGIHVKVVIDEGRMGGIHPYLFGSLLNHYLQMSVSVNAFVQFSLELLQSHEVITWPVADGERAIL